MYEATHPVYYSFDDIRVFFGLYYLGGSGLDMRFQSDRQKGRWDNQEKTRARPSIFQEQNGKWHGHAENTCHQEQYLPIEIQRIGLSYYDNVFHSLLMHYQLPLVRARSGICGVYSWFNFVFQCLSNSNGYL